MGRAGTCFEQTKICTSVDSEKTGSGWTLISVDISELENERRSLSIFLKSKIHVPIAVKDKMLVLDSKEKTVTSKDVKTRVKQFLYRKGLSETYKANVEHGVIRITKRRHAVRRMEKKGTPPSPYDTLPYYFPAHP